MALDDYPGKLNVFQRAMLQWNDMHPYHAVHVLRFQGVPELDRLQQSISDRLRACGLTGLRLDRDAGTFRYDDTPIPITLSTVTAGNDPVQTCNAEIERQLNQRIEISDRFAPFRFFVIAEQDSFLLGTTYFHPIADAESVALLLRDLAADYLTGRSAEPNPGLDCHPPRHDQLLTTFPAVVARKLLTLPANLRRMRRSYRAPLRDADDATNRFSLTTVQSETLTRLLETAHAWNITLHDLLIASLMKALSPLAPDRLNEKRRRNISLGSIVNVRRDHHIDSERTFGLFLGSFVVTHPVPIDVPLKELARDLNRQTQHIKANKDYLAAPLELSFAGRVIALYSTSRQRKFYHKHHPLWGGITNMNLNALWTADRASRPADYFRAVSTGPVTPMVLSATTYGDHMHIGLSYRPAVFAPEEVQQVLSGLNRQFNHLEEQA